MRVAAYNSFFGKYCAESELARRICLAAQNLGWEAIETGSSEELRNFKPDFVLVMHFNVPKLVGFPTYGCMWNPPIFFEDYESITKKKGVVTKNILSYDAYLSSSKKMDSWLQKSLSDKPKRFFIAPFYTSCNQTLYQVPNLDNPRLVYIGTNWDGTRFEQLFRELDTKEYMEVYGARHRWTHLNRAYKGTLPFDGTSILETLRKAGIGLCIHKPEHSEADIPSMRIFEIVASGTLAICGEHPFIREAFGDSVLYIKSDSEPIKQVEQISNYISWISNHKQEAIEMSKEAHDIFLQKFTLEKLLLDIVPYHQDLVHSKGFRVSTFSNQVQSQEQLVYVEPHKAQVQFIVRVGDRELEMVKRSLDSIANQTYKNVAVVIVKYKELEGINELLVNYASRMPIRVIESQYNGFRSSQLWDGLNAVDAEYFAILDDDNTIHSNHTSSLISLLEQFQYAGVAYSGSIRIWESENTTSHKVASNLEVASLACFENFNIRKIVNFDNFITSNSYIARSSLLDDIRQDDPHLTVSEDFCLLLHLCRKARFVFNYEATCEFYWREDGKDNAATLEDAKYSDQELVEDYGLKQINATDRLLNIFWNKDFPCEDTSLNDSLLPLRPLSTMKFYKLRYSKIELLFMNSKYGLPLPIYNFLRRAYLRLSGGGKANKSPGSIAKLLISFRKLMSE